MISTLYELYRFIYEIYLQSSYDELLLLEELPAGAECLVLWWQQGRPLSSTHEADQAPQGVARTTAVAEVRRLRGCYSECQPL